MFRIKHSEEDQSIAFHIGWKNENAIGRRGEKLFVKVYVNLVSLYIYRHATYKARCKWKLIKGL